MKNTDGTITFLNEVQATVLKWRLRKQFEDWRNAQLAIVDKFNESLLKATDMVKVKFWQDATHTKRREIELRRLWLVDVIDLIDEVSSHGNA